MRPFALHGVLLGALALAACQGGGDDTSDTGDTSDSGDTDSGDTDSGDTDSGDTDSGDTGDSGTGDTGDTGDTGPDPANWDFEDWTSDDPPPGFTKYPLGDWTVFESTDAVEGQGAAALTLSASATDRLLLAEGQAVLATAATVRFHAWVKDDDADVEARLVVQTYDAGDDLVATAQATNATTDASGWAEYTLDVAATAGQRLRPRLRVEEVTGTVAGSSVKTDAWVMTLPVAFDPTDGVEDAGAATVAGTPGATMDVAASVSRDGVLYVATNRADLDSDHLLFVWAGAPHDTETVALPWSKAGSVAAPGTNGFLAVLVQEQDNQFCEWLVRGPSAWATVTGSDCNEGDDGPRLEGSLPLPVAFGLGGPTDVPADLYFAVAPWETADGGALKSAFQVPAGDGDGALDPDEASWASRAALLAGRIPPTP